MGKLKSAQKYPFGLLGEEVKRAIRKDLDAKIIITSHNSKPGLGKTTLAAKMAKTWDPHGWSAEEKGFLDVYDYHDAYLNKKPGSVLLFDEVEGEADNRRSNSTENVELSQAWAQQRFRNMITICTLPTVSMLDKRMLELSDYWINVMRRGIAHPYRILVNDFNGHIYRKRLDDNATIKYSDLPDDDPDYNLLKKMKAESSEMQRTYYDEGEVNKKVEKTVKQERKDYRNDVIHELYETTDMSQNDIADFDFIDVNQSTVNTILNQ